MSLTSVLNYPSMTEVRTVLARMQGQHPLEMAYLTYHGHRKPSERQTEFSRIFAAHDFVRLDGPYSDNEVHAYLAGLCHAIWVEENVGLPWSLRDYGPYDLRFLLMRRVDSIACWTSRQTGETGCWGEARPGTPMPRELIADTWYQTYPLSFHLAGRQPDKRQVVLAFVSWIMVNFFHSYSLGTQENWPWTFYPSNSWFGRGDHLVTLADLFAQRVVGCHGPAKILAALLRSINIPAIEIHYQGHGICYVPTLGLYVHGDFLANFAVLRDNAALLMDLAELERWIFQPNDYTSFWEHITKTDPAHLDVSLRRRKFFLFLAGRLNEDDGPEGLPALSGGRGPEYYASLKVRLPEYGIHPVQGAYYSQRVYIRGLDIQPACGLAVDVDRDTSGRVRVTLENRGLDLPGNQGTLQIDIDGGRHAGGYDLKRIDQSFVRGGGRTTITTNFQLTADEHGIVRVTVTGLPQPCRDIAVMRHLGKALQPIGLQPINPSAPVSLPPIFPGP